MLERKQNVFDDFAAAAEWLIANKYTTPSKLAIEGGSNGGLLVGAALTQRPELFGAVLCAVPLLDMIRYQMFSIARLWVPEYGSSENEAQFAYLLKYSPYHNVRAGVKYPPVMLFSGDSDTRVDPLHARKMAALMQSQGADALLHYDTSSGHSGGLPVNKLIDDSADMLTYLWWKLHPAGGVQAGVKR
jgi:prolyl oligopeptidase